MADISNRGEYMFVERVRTLRHCICGEVIDIYVHQLSQLVLYLVVGSVLSRQKLVAKFSG